MGKQFWLVKQEPEDYPWSDFVKEKGTAWTGVRNYQARNYLRSMKEGDPVLYYHSGREKRAVGLARVSKSAYPDPSGTADGGDWSAVDLAPIKALKQGVTLAEIKADKTLQEMPLVRQSRLSVCPVTAAQFQRLLALSKTTL